MKKLMLPTSLLSLLCCTAFAQTNVTIYGVADVGITRTDTNAPGVDATWSMDSGIASGSRLGFRGTEDLGGGLSTLFVIENGFNVDTGAAGQGGRIFGRQAFVGLSGGFGTVKLGRQYTPIFTVLDAIDPFGTGLAGDITTVFNAYGVRTDNTVNYSYSHNSGLSGQIAYSLGEVAGSTSAGQQVGLALGYLKGPLNVMFAYHDANTVPSTTVARGDAKTALLGATYDFKVVKAHVAVASNEVEAAGITTGKSRNYMLGATVPVGAGNVVASINRHDQRTGAVSALALVGGASVDYDRYAVGYLHPLSKRTTLYTSVAKINVRAAGAADGTQANVGIRHRF